MRLRVYLPILALAVMTIGGCSSTRQKVASSVSGFTGLGNDTAADQAHASSQYDSDPPSSPVVAHEPPAVPPARGISLVRGISLTKLLKYSSDNDSSRTDTGQLSRLAPEIATVLFRRHKADCGECGQSVPAKDSCASETRRYCPPLEAACVPETRRTERYCSPSSGCSDAGCTEGCTNAKVSWLRLPRFLNFRTLFHSAAQRADCGDDGCGSVSCGTPDTVGGLTESDAIQAPEPDHAFDAPDASSQAPTAVPPVPQTWHGPKSETAISRQTILYGGESRQLSLESTGEQWLQPSQWPKAAHSL